MIWVSCLRLFWQLLVILSITSYEHQRALLKVNSMSLNKLGPAKRISYSINLAKVKSSDIFRYSVNQLISSAVLNSFPVSKHLSPRSFLCSPPSALDLKSNQTFTSPLVYTSFPFCSTLARIIFLEPTTQTLFHSHWLTASTCCMSLLFRWKTFLFPSNLV